MALHPQVRAFLDHIAIHNPLLENATLQELRADVYTYQQYAGPQASDVTVEHEYFTSPTADLHAVIFKPKNVKANAPALVYFHGGGWGFSFPLRYAATLTNMSAESGFIIIAVNYQKAPEHPFPTPFDDCYAGLLWVAKNAERLGVDPTKIGVGGDSAGGNLAAAVALKAGDTEDVQLAFQMLIYPCLSIDFDTDSYKAHATGFGLDRDGMIGAWDLYVPKEHLTNKYAVPANATTFTNLAPAIIALAEHDVLHDDGANYAKALDAAGIPVTFKQFPGMIHGFLNHGLMVDGTYEMRKWLSAQIVEAVTSPK
ncbi:MAG: alpha/beta hydrolase [Streptomycetaceae bacterium]|nr:MAG: alpha/beta hydrolase [Streptomycetaceae bacterium]